MGKVNIGNILRNMRTTNTNLSQKEIGEKLILADTTISSYERGNSQPDFETIINFANICEFELILVNQKTNEEFSVEELSKEM